jgi:hypothetical protein
MTDFVRTSPFRLFSNEPGTPSRAQRLQPMRRRGHARVQRLALVLAALLSFAMPVLAEEEGAGEAKVSEAYTQAMRAYLESQDTHSQFGEGVAYQVANETLMMIASTGAQVTEQMQSIVLEEALSTYSAKFSDLDFLTTLWAPVYAEHFSVDELKAMTEWFKSELGHKVVSLTQMLNEAGMMEIQKASVALSPEFQLAVDARLREAGFAPNEPVTQP